MRNSFERVPAGFWIRAAALALDSIIVWAVCLFIRLPIALGNLFSDMEIPTVLFQYDLVDVICYIISTLYFTFLTGRTGGTLGKKAMGIEVIRADNGEKIGFWLALYRETVGRYLTAIGNIGYIYAAADDQKRGFHDLLSGTLVVYQEVPRKERHVSSETENKQQKTGDGSCAMKLPQCVSGEVASSEVNSGDWTLQ